MCAEGTGSLARILSRSESDSRGKSEGEYDVKAGDGYCDPGSPLPSSGVVYLSSSVSDSEQEETALDSGLATSENDPRASGNPASVFARGLRIVAGFSVASNVSAVKSLCRRAGCGTGMNASRDIASL